MNKVGTAPAENKRGDATELPPGAGPGAEEVFGIRIARDGTWYHEGGPIRRIELVKLFATVLRRDEAGDHWLVTPVERGRIEVEDAPFVAVEVAVRGSGRDQVLSFRTNLDEWVEAGPDHPIRVAGGDGDGDGGRGGPVPYVAIRNGLEARVARPVYYELVDRCATDGDGGEDEIGLWSKGTFFALGRWPGA